MDINIRKNLNEKFEDARPKIQEVAVRVGLSKMLSYWAAISRWALILLAALAPIFFLPFTNLPVAVHKELLVFVLILAAFFALLGRILIEGRFRYPGHLLTLALLTLVLVWGVSTFFSFNQLTSLIGSWATPDSFFSILLFVILTLSVAMTFNRRDIVISLLAFLSSLSLLGLFELSQLLKIFILPFGFAKNIGFNPIGSVNDVGVLLAFGLVIASGLMSTPDLPAQAGMSKTLKKLLGLAVLVFIINLVVIDFWAIWIGLALAMIFMISFLSAGLRSEQPTPTLPYQGGRNPLDKGDTGGLGREQDAGYQGLQLAYFQKAWLPSIILLVSLLLLFIPSPLSKLVQTPVEVSPNFNSTLDIGLQNLKAGRYLLGSGPGTFGSVYNLYKPVSINQTIFWSTVFNSGASALATWVGTVGILGVLAILFLIAAFVWTGRSATHPMKSPLIRGERGRFDGETHPSPPLSGREIGGVLTSQSIFAAVIFMFMMWFLYVANFTNMAFAFWGMGLFLAASFFSTHPMKSPLIRGERGGFDGETHPSPPLSGREPGGVFREIRIFTSPSKTFLFSFLIVGLMVGAIAGIYFEANRYIAEIYFSKSDFVSAIKFWQYDERYFQSLSQATFSQLNDLLARKDLSQETLRAQFQNITTNAISAGRQAQNLNPQNPSNGVLLGNIYENLIPFIADAASFALSAYSGAAALDPQNPSHYLAMARVEIAQADLDKAVFNLEKSVGLKNDYAPSRFLLVQVYDRQGKLTDAIKRAEELVMLNNADVGALFQLGFLYYKNSQFDESRQVFERTVQLSPNYSNARYFLGLIYNRESEVKAKALEQFLIIAALNPDNDEVKKIITNLRAGRSALFGIVPPAPAPQARSEAPVQEGAKAPVKPLKK